MEDVNELIYQSVEQIIESIQKLAQLLLDDSRSFEKNDMTTINQNNEMKLQLLSIMSSQVNQLQCRIPLTEHGKQQTLSEYLGQLDYHHANRIRNIIAKLHRQVTDGYQKLVINNNIVTSNLGMMNAVMEKLLKFSKQNLGIYEKPEMK